MRIISLFIIVVIVCCKQPATHQIDTVKNDKEAKTEHRLKRDTILTHHKTTILSHFKNLIEQSHFNGHILVAMGNTIIIDTTTGYSNIVKRIPLEHNNAIQLASITKPITATVILQLVEEGKLQISDTITKYLPNLPKHYSHITIEHLLAHRSGFAQYYYYCDKMLDNRRNMIYNDTLLCLIHSHNPDHYFKPGKQHNYCNTNYMLLASIIESIENKRYPAVVKERIFNPCKMYDSFVLDIKEDSLPINLVLGHNLRGEIFQFDYLDGIVGDKGVFSNAKDLFKFDRFLSACGILSDSLVQLAHSPHNEIKKNASYGYGWRLRFHDNLGKIVYHTGWWHGNRNLYFKIPNSDYTVIMISNALKGSLYNLNELLEVFDFKEEAI